MLAGLAWDSVLLKGLAFLMFIGRVQRAVRRFICRPPRSAAERELFVCDRTYLPTWALTDM